METEALFASSEWVNAGGVFLLLTGVSFLILEFFLPSFGLFGFAGVSAILIGIVQLHQTGYIEEMPFSANGFIGLSLLGLVLSAFGGWYSWRLYKKKVSTGIEGMIGETAHVMEWSGTEGRVQIQGETWQAYADKELSLNKDDKAIVAKVDGLKIKIITNI